ncbi:MAG: hypothetical protein AAF171_10025, partial [Cyanobacteria bacterium P01_A01_bin.116]
SVRACNRASLAASMCDSFLKHNGLTLTLMRSFDAKHYYLLQNWDALVKNSVSFRQRMISRV